MTGFLKLPTNFSSGIAAGGGDTTWGATVQPTLLTKRLTDTSTTATAKLPAGTILLETWILPDPDAIPTAGTVTAVGTDAAGNAVTYINAEAATAYAKASISPIGALDTDTSFAFSAASLSTGSKVDVGLLVILPTLTP